MINLIYVVLLAMMAINVSSDVMKGFTVLSMNSDRQIRELARQHELLWNQCKLLPDTVAVQKADSIHAFALSLNNLADTLRERIIRQADGEDYQQGRLLKAEDMKAVPYVMLAPTQGGGGDLRHEIERFRAYLFASLPDTVECGLLSVYLSTSSPSKYSWEREMFSTLPAVGGVLYLNQLEANVLSSSNIAFRSLLDAVSSASQNAGERNDTVLMSPHGMNVIYAGVPNELDVHAFGDGQVDLSVSNGRAYQSKGRWFVSQVKVGECRVEARMDGRLCGRSVLRVRELPAPSAAVVYRTGQASARYQGRTPVKKADFLKADGLEAAYSDGFLSYTSRVVGFEMIFIGSDGQVSTLKADGHRFTAAQRARVRACASGEKFYISAIMVEYPDGSKREIEPMEVFLI